MSEEVLVSPVKDQLEAVKAIQKVYIHHNNKLIHLMNNNNSSNTCKILITINILIRLGIIMILTKLSLQRAKLIFIVDKLKKWLIKLKPKIQWIMTTSMEQTKFRI